MRRQRLCRGGIARRSCSPATVTADIAQRRRAEYCAPERMASGSIAIAAMIAEVSNTIRKAVRPDHSPGFHPRIDRPKRAFGRRGRRTSVSRRLYRHLPRVQSETTVPRWRARGLSRGPRRVSRAMTPSESSIWEIRCSCRDPSLCGRILASPVKPPNQRACVDARGHAASSARSAATKAIGWSIIT